MPYLNFKNMRLLHLFIIVLGIQINNSFFAEDVSSFLEESVSKSELSATQDNNQTIFTKWENLSRLEKVVASITGIAVTIITLQFLLYIVHDLSDRPPLKVKPCTDKKILELFDTIKKDMDVTEDIPLFITTESDFPGKYMRNVSKIPFNFTTKLTGISVNLDMIKNDYCRLIYIIAHELGHHLQFSNAQGAYQSKQKSIPFFLFGGSDKKEDAKKLEIGADATAVGYQDCQNCLEHNKNISWPEHSPSHKKGYFCDTDYDSYIQRAKEEGWQCPAHANIGTPDSIKYHSLDFSKYEPKDFLPQTYDRTHYK